MCRGNVGLLREIAAVGYSSLLFEAAGADAPQRKMLAALWVAEIFYVPLAFLMNPANHRKHVWQPTPQYRREWFSMPYTDPANGQERFIWGATAGILRDLYQFLSA